MEYMNYRNQTHAHQLAAPKHHERYEDDSNDQDTTQEMEYDEDEPSGTDEGEDEDDSDMDESMQDEIEDFETAFPKISQQYRLVKKIGEGTFSTVYKAEDLYHDEYENEWEDTTTTSTVWVPPSRKTGSQSQGYSGDYRRPPARFVAIKKIYVTSSPLRILNELELLNDLRGSKYVSPLITAHRSQDQVIAVLPYYSHHDFREVFRDIQPYEMQVYMRALFRGLEAVHDAGIIHRDIKPTNFLYNRHHQTGVLVDFGLAEREGDSKDCPCAYSKSLRDYRMKLATSITKGYIKNDTRPSRRANRAGTRGFRAPEVLLKCANQSTKIDIWSAGVVLLTMLTHRFPFFNSTNDVDALVELTTCFGKKRMQECANLHGTVLECTLPSVGEKGHSLSKLITWSTNREMRDLESDEISAIKFLERCLVLDPKDRITAYEALDHPFLADELSMEDVNVIG